MTSKSYANDSERGFTDYQDYDQFRMLIIIAKPKIHDDFFKTLQFIAKP